MHGIIRTGSADPKARVNEGHTDRFTARSAASVWGQYAPLHKSGTERLGRQLEVDEGLSRYNDLDLLD